MLKTVRAFSIAALLALAAWTGASEPVAHAAPAAVETPQAGPEAATLCQMVCIANQERCALKCIDGDAGGEPECADNCSAVYALCMSKCKGGA